VVAWLPPLVVEVLVLVLDVELLVLVLDVEVLVVVLDVLVVVEEELGLVEVVEVVEPEPARHW
jgi:hypothetical protein